MWGEMDVRVGVRGGEEVDVGDEIVGEGGGGDKGEGLNEKVVGFVDMLEGFELG